MFEAAKFIHMVSLGLVALAISNAFLGPFSAHLGEGERSALKQVMAYFGRAGRAGLLLLWISGLLMFVTRYGGDISAMASAFHAKRVFVIIATIGVIVIDYSPLRHKAGVVPIGGAVSDAAFVAAVALAVVAFN